MRFAKLLKNTDVTPNELILFIQQLAVGVDEIKIIFGGDVVAPSEFLLKSFAVEPH